MPSLGARSINHLDMYVRDTLLTMKMYMDDIFCQPNYYQKSVMSDGSSYTYDKLRDTLVWIRNIGYPNVSVELEGDRVVLGLECVDGRDCPEGMNCDGGLCGENCRDSNPSTCVEKACDYVNAQYDTKGGLWVYRAYYFSTDLKVVDTVRNYCSKW